MFNSIVFFKIGLTLFGCSEKYTLQSTHCAVESTAPMKTLKIELYLTSCWPWEDGEEKFCQILEAS